MRSAADVTGAARAVLDDVAVGGVRARSRAARRLGAGRRVSRRAGLPRAAPAGERAARASTRAALSWPRRRSRTSTSHLSLARSDRLPPPSAARSRPGPRPGCRSPSRGAARASSRSIPSVSSWRVMRGRARARSRFAGRRARFSLAEFRLAAKDGFVSGAGNPRRGREAGRSGVRPGAARHAGGDAARDSRDRRCARSLAARVGKPDRADLRRGRRDSPRQPAPARPAGDPARRRGALRPVEPGRAAQRGHGVAGRRPRPGPGRRRAARLAARRLPVQAAGAERRRRGRSRGSRAPGTPTSS